MGIRGGQIRDETIESVDLASGSIKAAEADEQLISGQPTLGSADTTNDRLLIWDADGSASGTLKQIAPTNLGVGGSGSPGGSDTQVQFNDGSSFGGDAGLTFNKTSGLLTVAKGAVFNEGSHDSDFRVESNGNANMLFVNGGTDRVGIGTDAPLTTLHISGSASTDASITIQGQADAGIRLAADKANGDEGNNPYIDWYQDGQNPTSRKNRVAMIAMEGDAGTAFTGSLANSLFIDTFCPNSQASNSRRFQIATDCSSSSDGANHSARLTIEGGHGYVGLHTTAATSPLHVYSNESGNYAALIDNDNSSSGHGLKVTSDGTGSGTNLLDVEAASTTVFRVRGDGRVGIGKVASLPAAMLTVSSSNTDSDIAIAHKIHHVGDSDTYIEFADDEISLAAGGRTFIKIEESSADKLTINNGGLDIDLKVSGENLANLIRTDAANDRVAIGHSAPDAILHIDNGTSNTEVIIEKDAGTSGSIVFHNAGSREAEIAFSTNEDIEITNWVADKDIIFATNDDSAGAQVEVMRIDGSEARVGIGTASPSALLDVDGTANATTLSIGGTSITSTAAEINKLDESTVSEASDGAWAMVERIAKCTIDSNDWTKSTTPVTLGVTIPDNAIITQVQYDCTQLFSAATGAATTIAVVDLGLYDGNTATFALTNQATLDGDANASPYIVGQSAYYPGISVPGNNGQKNTGARVVKFQVLDDGEGMLNNLDAGAMDVYIYYIIGA